MLRAVWTFVGICGGLAVARADVVLPPLFASGMVLQRDRPVPVWGRGEPGERVAVSYEGQEVITTVSDDGRWVVYLEAMAARLAGGELVVAGRNRLTFTDVVVGEVWLCAGPSGFEASLSQVERAPGEGIAAGSPWMRQFTVTRAGADVPTDAIGGEWRVGTSEHLGTFSAVGYFFARELHRKLGIPIGLIRATWEDAPIEAWMSPAALASEPEFAAIVDRGTTPASAGAGGELPRPSALFNGMINPVVPYGLRGVLWSAGKTDVSRVDHYASAFAALVKYWRIHFGQGELPFYWVQAGSVRTANAYRGEWARLREGQSRGLALPRTAQVVTIDLGPGEEPTVGRAFEIGRRLALVAKARIYGGAGDYSGPEYVSAEREKTAMRVRFRHASNGLLARDRVLQSFEVASADRVFFPARAVIQGDTLLVSAPEVKAPAAVRYAWRNAPEANLFNGAGLPAAPFRSDDWK